MCRKRHVTVTIEATEYLDSGQWSAVVTLRLDGGPAETSDELSGSSNELLGLAPFAALVALDEAMRTPHACGSV